MKTLPGKRFRILLAAAGICGAAAAPSSKAAVLYSEDFSAATNTWGTSSTYSGGAISFADGAASGAPFSTRSLLVTHDQSSTNVLLSTNPASQFSISRGSTDTWSFQFDVRLDSTTANVQIYFYDAVNNSQRPLNLIVANGNFSINYWDASNSIRAEKLLLSGYSVNTTYTFTFQAKPGGGVFSAGVTGGFDSLVNAPFNRTSTGTDIYQNFNRLQIQAFKGTGPYGFYLDNIQVAQIPEPSGLPLAAISLGLVAVGLRYGRRTA